MKHPDKRDQSDSNIDLAQSSKEDIQKVENEPDLILPGELKWSKEEEGSQDIGEIIIQDGGNHQSGESDDSRQIEDTGSGLRGDIQRRSSSLEDTLTPLEFKEYSFLTGEGERSQADLPGSVTADQKEVAKEKSVKKGLRSFFKVMWLPLLLFMVLIVGLIVGHTVIGDKPAGNVFDMNTWKHMYEMLFG